MESHSREVIALWRQADEIITSSVAYAETVASIFRKIRESGFEDSRAEKILTSFQRDWTSFVRVEVTDDLNPAIDKIIRK